MASIRLQQSVEELAEAVRGPVMTADDPGFADECACFNASVVHGPAVVVGATCAEDVQAAVRWAARNDLRVSVQATGHGASIAYDDGVLVTTGRMDGVQVDPVTRLAIIEGGTKWRRVIEEGAPLGLAPLNGSSSDVGAVGYTVGGGLAVLGRTFGFASDWVRALDVVTADGELRRATADEEPDLFWALRGGKADVGIVTSMTVELLPVSEFYGGAIYYDGEHAPEILRTYAEWTRSLPDEMTTTLSLMRLPNMDDVPEPLRERFTVQLCVAYIGDAAAGDELVRPMRDVAPAIIDYVGIMPYTEVDRVHNDPPEPLPFEYSSVVLSDLSAEAIDVLLAQAGPGANTPLLMVEIRHLGGAMAREGNDAVGLRTSGYAVMFLGVMFPELAAIVPVAIASVFDALALLATGASFVNLHGAVKSETDRVRPWPAETAARLREVKARFDPDNRFRVSHWG